MKVRNQSKIFYILHAFPICATSDYIYNLDYISLHSSWEILAYYTQKSNFFLMFLSVLLR